MIDFEQEPIKKLLTKLAVEERSKLLGNIVRYDVFCCLHREDGYEAIRLLQLYWESDRLTKLLGGDTHQATNIYEGVKREVQFFRKFATTLNLVPTLDAGCAFDFVGSRNNVMLRIDVTQNLENKERYDSAKYIRGPSDWKIIFAEVDAAGIMFAGKDYRKCGNGRVYKHGSTHIQLNTNFKRDALFFVARFSMMKFLELGKKLSFLFPELLITAELSCEQSQLLIAHMLFYIYYKEKLNLVAALNCGNCADFIGTSGAKEIRYLVLCDGKDYLSYWDGYVSTITTMGVVVEVVVFDPNSKAFAFYGKNHYHEIVSNTDIPEGDNV